MCGFGVGGSWVRVLKCPGWEVEVVRSLISGRRVGWGWLFGLGDEGLGWASVWGCGVLGVGWGGAYILRGWAMKVRCGCSGGYSILV